MRHLLAAGALFLATVTALADPPSGPRIYGLVRGTDAGKGNLVLAVQHDDDDMAEHTVVVATDVPVRLLNKPQATLRDLRPGMRIEIQLSADERFVRGVREWRALGAVPADRQPGVEGTVRRVEADDKRLTLTVRDETGPQVITFGVSGSAPITLKGNAAPAKLGELKPGMRVILSLRDNDNKVRAVTQLAEDGK